MASDPERQGDEMEDLDDDKESSGGFEQIGDEPQILNRPDFLAKIQGRLGNTDAVLQVTEKHNFCTYIFLLFCFVMSNYFIIAKLMKYFITHRLHHGS